MCPRPLIQLCICVKLMTATARSRSVEDTGISAIILVATEFGQNLALIPMCPRPLIQLCICVKLRTATARPGSVAVTVKPFEFWPLQNWVKIWPLSHYGVQNSFKLLSLFNVSFFLSFRNFISLSITERMRLSLNTWDLLTHYSSLISNTVSSQNWNVNFAQLLLLMFIELVKIC